MKRYFIRVLAGISVFLLAVLAFNLLINPYDLFAMPEVEGLNRYKSEIDRHTRLSKVYQVEKLQPQAILLASSRGLEIPENYFTEGAMSGLNMSLTSASMYELYRIFQHAQAASRIKRIVLALDEEFRLTKQPGFIEGRLLVREDGSENTQRWRTRIKDIFNSLMSLDALRASLRTIRKQKDNPGAMGYRKYMAKRVYNAGGHRQMFRNVESGIFSSYQGAKSECRKKTQNRAVASADASGYFEKLVDAAYRHNIELYIYFSPVHARLYQAKCMVGKWTAMENMKRTVVRVVEEKAGQYHADAYPVWDFSGYSVVNSEEVPALGDKTRLMQGYYEGSHYTLMTARKVFDVIFTGVRAVPDFGTRLGRNNIEQHLLKLRFGRDDYIAGHSDDISELERLFLDSRKLR